MEVDDIIAAQVSADSEVTEIYRTSVWRVSHTTVVGLMNSLWRPAVPFRPSRYSQPIGLYGLPNRIEKTVFRETFIPEQK